jgi:hypothetical protein
MFGINYGGFKQGGVGAVSVEKLIRSPEAPDEFSALDSSSRTET